jgi:hypothetical protein
MVYYTQIIGENINYEQDILGDTIETAAWSCTPPALPGISSQIITSPTSAVAAFESSTPGNFVLEVTLTLASGQIRIGQARIRALEDLV